MNDWTMFFVLSAVGLILGAVGISGLIYLIKE